LFLAKQMANRRPHHGERHYPNYNALPSISNVGGFGLFEAIDDVDLRGVVRSRCRLVQAAVEDGEIMGQSIIDQPGLRIIY